MALQLRTAYIAPSSRVFGRGELVIDPAQMSKRYFQRWFIIDFLSVLPAPQVGDLRLARWQPEGDKGVLTRVVGTFGY
ncbi:predicted protein [Arabidopsis lyrata subsp. lyrata]|uniref:Predicted protein n=1 Tax=Arabidopsis lyrata subsp. lyrata TaxID=81972 RepID=D7MNX7_ARALL|nr:predicted protein [Arabidopsis lyrata subsp. lyrata]